MGDLLEILENFREKRKLRISNSATVPKSVKRKRALWEILASIHSVAKFPIIEGDSLVLSKNLRKKSNSAEKIQVKKPRESKRDP